MENLCEDLLVDILCRLPPKDLLRARCVSKEWNELVHVCIRKKSMEFLCEDLLVDILCRLPPKDLLRARCVCKEWDELIVHVCIPRILPDSRVTVGLGIASLIFEFDAILSDLNQ